MNQSPPEVSSNNQSDSLLLALAKGKKKGESRKEGGEAWTYDKISWLTESSSLGGVGTGWTPKFFGIFGGNKSRNEKSSKNITLIIKLNGDGNVEDFKYQSVKY